MVRTAVGFLGLLALLPALWASEKPENQTPSEQYQALVKEYNKAQQEYQKALKGVKTREERQKVFNEKYPRPDKFASRFLEVAEKNPKDPAAVDALVWIVTNAGTMKSDPKTPRGKAVRILLRDHVQSEKMAELCPRLRNARDEDSEHLLRAVLEKSKDRPAQAQACLALAQQAENRVQLAEQFKERPALAKNYETFMGKEYVEALTKAGPEKLSKDVEVLYERIVKDFADVADPKGNKLGELAKDKLDELRHPIAVGKEAPEIACEDIDGKKFKLSDYRGKVVLLDFWGNW